MPNITSRKKTQPGKQVGSCNEIQPNLSSISAVSCSFRLRYRTTNLRPTWESFLPRYFQHHPERARAQHLASISRLAYCFASPVWSYAKSLDMNRDQSNYGSLIGRNLSIGILTIIQNGAMCGAFGWNNGACHKLARRHCPITCFLTLPLATFIPKYQQTQHQ